MTTGDLFRQSEVRHPDDVADPPQLVLNDGSFDAGGHGLLENPDVGAVVLPDAENAPQAALVEYIFIIYIIIYYI